MLTNEAYQLFSETNNEKNVWPEYQKIFRLFWQDKIMTNNSTDLDDADIDPIIRMLDQNGKGNTKGSIVVAKAFIRMGMWYRAFRSLKENSQIREKLNQIFLSTDDNELIALLNKFESLNRGNSNGLTGRNAVIINALLCLNNPRFYISAVSLEHRKRILEFLYGHQTDFSSYGESIILSNRKILDYFESIDIRDTPRNISLYIYNIKNQWESISNITIPTENENESTENECNNQIFVIEKYLEDFLIGNWESTELGKKYDLIFENNELISQQYKTDIGIIDLLVKEKNTDNYVVIELKRNQTTDVTVGQIMRYLGWVKFNLSPENPVKGIIIGYTNDDKLNYAISCVDNIEVFLYRINFSLIKTDVGMKIS